MASIEQVHASGYRSFERSIRYSSNGLDGLQLQAKNVQEQLLLLEEVYALGHSLHYGCLMI